MTERLHQICLIAAGKVDAEASLGALQLTSPVQWEKSVNLLLHSGLEESYEIGPNKVLAGIFKRIDKKHKITNVQV